MKSKKAINFETYTRYSWVAEKEQKKVLGVFSGSFWAALLKGAIAFLILKE